MFDIDKSLNKMLGKTRKRGGSKDWDGDGVPNKKDCQPRNTMRQDEVNAFEIQDISQYKRVGKKLGLTDVVAEKLARYQTSFTDGGFTITDKQVEVEIKRQINNSGSAGDALRTYIGLSKNFRLR